MSSSLYSDAINDAKALKEAAEERAKQQLLESMSPKLKKIVESTINQEMGLYESDLDEDDVEECGTYEADETNEAETCETDESDMPESISLDEIDLEDEDDSKGLKNESYNVLNKILSSSVLSRNASNVINDFDVKLKHLKESFALASKNRVTNRLIEKIDTQIKELVEESKNIASSDIIKNNNQIKTKFKNSLQELNNMTRRRNSILAENYASLVRGRRLFEEDEVEQDEDMDMDMPEDEGMDMSDDDMGGDDQSFTHSDLEGLKNDIVGSFDKLLGGGEEEFDMGDMDMGSEEGEEEEEMQEEGWGEAAEGMDEMYEVDEVEEEDEADMHTESRRRRFMEARKKKDLEEKAKKKKKEKEEKMKEAQRRGGDVFLEIDENMLRREIARMKRLREGDAQSMASHFGGGKLEDEMFVDMDDSDLNVNANNLGRNLKEGYNSGRQNRLLESKVRQQTQALAGMKKQLSEVNLFNAKLLYANKLMQNRDLTAAQQRHIVESLDQASNLREAKLLFEGLSKSLSRGTSRSSTLTEGAARRMTGGSSRSTLSAQSVETNRVEVDRWALLAGIKK